MFKVTGNGQASVTFDLKNDSNWLAQLPDDTTIHYLPMDIPMICFIKMSFNQLASSKHCDEYGKMGLVFTEDFLKKKGIKPVSYYTEKSLWQDELIKRWNFNQDKLSARQKAALEREILSHRKPASLFPTFKESVTMKMTTSAQGTNLEYLTYNRYPQNYDFTKENEHRIVFEQGADYLYFNESDLFMLITPNYEVKNIIEMFLSRSWHQIPLVKIYPSN